MQAVNKANININAFEPTTSIPQSLYSGSFSTALDTSVDSLGTSKTFFDSEYLTLTSSELQNGQLKPINFAQVMELPIKCLVCGHPTNCCHYGVRSCNGCKTFFRRSLLQSRTYSCRLNGMCSRMNGIKRCRACRFDRCVLVGMNPRAIQFITSVDAAEFSDKVENRRHYLTQMYGGRCPVLIEKTGPVFEETIEDKIIQSLVYIELNVKKIRESFRWPSGSVIFRSIREILESNNENVLAHADQYPKELRWPLTSTSDIDKAHWLEQREGRPNWLILDMFLCIEMARIMPVFSQLSYNDQEALLKQIILANTLLVHAFYSYQMKSEILVMPNGFSPAKLTMEEFVLLKAIIYSHPAIHGLSKRGKVLLEKESIRYSKTLMKHLQSRMGAAPGAKKYAEIISFVGCLFHCAQQQREVHVYMSTPANTKHSLDNFSAFDKWGLKGSNLRHYRAEPTPAAELCRRLLPINPCRCLSSRLLPLDRLHSVPLARSACRLKPPSAERDFAPLTTCDTSIGFHSGFNHSIRLCSDFYLSQPRLDTVPADQTRATTESVPCRNLSQQLATVCRYLCRQSCCLGRNCSRAACLVLPAASCRLQLNGPNRFNLYFDRTPLRYWPLLHNSTRPAFTPDSTLSIRLCSDFPLRGLNWTPFQ
ncbi:zinc finger, c4 type (two domains) domain-containing protein [Ditylenchus destructor]|nr:zinc finger, c4 type (two domains) domain-containing protein [Ditylenchus destructor]